MGIMKPIQLPDIPDHERTPLVKSLLEIIERLVETVQRQDEVIGQLRDEIAVLKGEKKRPVLKPSKMAEQAGQEGANAEAEHKKKRAGSEKRSKTFELRIDEDRIIAPAQPIPEGSRFKGYQDYVVQDLVITSHNLRYRLERWQTPNGKSSGDNSPHRLRVISGQP